MNAGKRDFGCLLRLTDHFSFLLAHSSPSAKLKLLVKEQIAREVFAFLDCQRCARALFSV